MHKPGQILIHTRRSCSRSNTQIMARREDEKGKETVVDLTNESDDEQHQDIDKIELGSYDCQVFYCVVPEA